MEAPIGGGGGNDGLDVKVVTLQTFKNRVDELLTSLAESPAEPGKISEQKVTADAYGTGFSAAKDLHSGYEKVRARLEDLSKAFGDTIEALGIAVQVADKGYSGVDAEIKERYLEIAKRHREVYGQQAPNKTEGSTADTAQIG